MFFQSFHFEGQAQLGNEVLGTVMRVTFKEIIYSQSFQQHATMWAKNGIFVAIITLIGMAIFANANLGIKWLFVFLWALFGTSLLISLPTFLLYAWLASIQSTYSFIPSGRPINFVGRIILLLKYIVSILHILISGFAIYFVINFING
jgi:hypothetical protein